MPITAKWVPQTQQRFLCIESDCTGKLDTIYTMNEHLANLKKAIDNKQSDKLLDLFTYEAQFSVISATRAATFNSNGSYTPAAYYMETCFIIEALFLHNPKLLAELVQELIAVENIDLYNALVKSLQIACLPQNLLVWNADVKRRMVESLKEIKQYGDYLGTVEMANPNILHASREKSKETAKLVTSLDTKLSKFGVFKYQDKDCLLGELPKYLADLHILKFRLEFSDLLHTKDEALNHVSDITAYAASNTAGFLALGIPNAINYLVNGQFFFYTKPKSQQNVEKLAQIVLPVYR